MEFVNAIRRSAVLTLIAVNTLVFLALRAVVWCGVPDAAVAEAVALPAAMTPAKLYTALTYMFVHFDFWHLLFNMLWLWTFGALAARTGVSGSRITAAYFTGGIAAAVAFVITSASAPAGILVGASASVLAVIGLCGILLVRRSIRLMVLGKIQVSWLALGVIVLILLTSATGQNFAASAAHISGAIAGILLGLVLLFADNRRAAVFTADSGNSGKRHDSAPRGSHYRPGLTKGLTPAEQAELDTLLDRVRQNGYAGLNPADRTRLFQLSAKIK